VIIAVTQLKGGTGKTTTAMHLAACAHEDGLRPIVVDADSEPSAEVWAAPGRLPFPVVAVDEDDLAAQVKKLARKGHTVIIDGRPNDRDALRAAASVADMVVVPVRAAGLDINRMRSTLRLLLEVEMSRKGAALRTRVLLTMVGSNTVLRREAVGALERFPTFETHVRYLQDYARSFGKAPYKLNEYRMVWREIRHVLGG
jgi:chromosome partitioning protein